MRRYVSLCPAKANEFEVGRSQQPIHSHRRVPTLTRERIMGTEMDNELDGRLRRLETGQADQATQLSRLVDGQERVHQTLTELVRLMTEPDEEAVKLQEVLASLVRVMAENSATLRRLERRLAGQSNEGPGESH